MSAPPRYVLGSDDAEITRLDGQAALLASPTAILLRAAGIGAGMRVLDLGTGLGHVALEVAGLVGPAGAVVGVDQDERMVRVARERAEAGGARNVRFVRADARTYGDGEPFDAVVMRLLLFHLPDAVDVVRRQREALRPGGTLLALDYDLGAVRTEPPVALLQTAARWIEDGFRAARADPRVGARLPLILRDAGFTDVTTLGLQSYHAPEDPAPPMLVAGVVRSLAAQIEAAGIADADELGLDALQGRIAAALRSQDAAILMPTLVGSWARA